MWGLLHCALCVHLKNFNIFSQRTMQGDISNFLKIQYFQEWRSATLFFWGMTGLIPPWLRSAFLTGLWGRAFCHMRMGTTYSRTGVCLTTHLSYGDHPFTHLRPRLSWGLPRPRFTFIENSERLPAVGVQATGSNWKPGRNGEAGDGEAGRDIARSEKLVIEQLLNGWTGSGICLKHLLDEGGSHGVDVLEQRGRDVSRMWWETRMQHCHKEAAAPASASNMPSSAVESGGDVGCQISTSSFTEFTSVNLSCENDNFSFLLRSLFSKICSCIIQVAHH